MLSSSFDLLCVYFSQSEDASLLFLKAYFRQHPEILSSSRLASSHNCDQKGFRMQDFTTYERIIFYSKKSLTYNINNNHLISKPDTKLSLFSRKKQRQKRKKVENLHAFGVYLSMYWLKSRRNWVLLSDSFSSLQYSLKKQTCFNLCHSVLPLRRANTTDHSPWGNEGVTILVKPLQL